MLLYYRATIEMPIQPSDEVTFKAGDVVTFKAGDVVTLKADERRPIHRVTVGGVEGTTVQVFWFTHDMELKTYKVPAGTLVKVELPP